MQIFTRLLRRLWRRMTCRHVDWRVVAIEWDGTLTCQCKRCRKHVSKGL